MDYMAIKKFIHLPPKPDPIRDKLRQFQPQKKLVSFRGVNSPPCCSSCPSSPRGGILKSSRGYGGSNGRVTPVDRGILKRRAEVWEEEERKNQTISFHPKVGHPGDEGNPYRPRRPRYQFGPKSPYTTHPDGYEVPYQTLSPYSYEQYAIDQDYDDPYNLTTSDSDVMIASDDQYPPIDPGTTKDQWLPTNMGQHDMPFDHRDYGYPIPLTSEEMNFGKYLHT